ncbi:rhomboid family intramembrane serine protease [Actinopolyspora halophila]|uniref:rhomboid family intramembrane serine protease n=1 Tax=Actinopolyspora halophila TaxID=1850 RepID=UPI001FE1CC76|nr:rhomboid family intramembrane serine protease [Actinopolyspora halophila]
MGSGSRRKPRVLPPHPGRAAAVALAFVALLYVLELIDQLFFQMGPTTPGRVYGLDVNGIQPREVEGLDGIVWAPLLHYGWEHLMANTLPLLVLGWLCMAGGIRRFVVVTAMIWVVGGLGTWLVAAESTTHLGASGIAFGWLMFLLVRGFFTGSVAQILVAVVLVVYWGGMLWGVLPGQQGVSWQAHLFGAVGGVLAAWLVTRSDRPHRAGSARSGDLPGRLGS